MFAGLSEIFSSGLRACGTYKKNKEMSLGTPKCLPVAFVKKPYLKGFSVIFFKFLPVALVGGTKMGL